MYQSDNIIMSYLGKLVSFFMLCLLAAALPAYPSAKSYNIAKWAREGLVGLGPRQEHAVAAINNTIYVVGGVIYNDTFSLVTTARVEGFDVEQRRWSVPAPLPHPINHVNLASVKGQLYSFGGLVGQHPADPVWLAVKECNKYDPKTDTWSSIAPMPGIARASSTIGVYGSTVYIAGGMSRLEATANGTQDALSTVSSYDTISDTWRGEYPDLPSPRQHAGGAVVNGILYVIGGREAVGKHYATVFALQLDRPSVWTQRAPMLTSRGGLACSALYDRYIVCAGGEGNTDNPPGVFEETELYDTVLNKWTQLPPMEIPRHGTAAVALGSKMYSPGGGIASGGAGGTGGFFDYRLFEGL